MSSPQSTPRSEDNLQGRKTFESTQLNEQKFDLAQLMQEVTIERQNSNLAKQIIDQKEIQKTILEHIRKKSGNNDLNGNKQ